MRHCLVMILADLRLSLTLRCRDHFKVIVLYNNGLWQGTRTGARIGELLLLDVNTRRGSPDPGSPAHYERYL